MKASKEGEIWMYLFINKNNIQKYNGEVLKRFVGKKLVKTIANPTEEELKEFGYMKQIESEKPEYDNERQFLECEYETIDGVIQTQYTVLNLPGLDATEGQI